MPRKEAVSIENNFTRGLITEATGLKFPENACTETYDCKFDRLGAVRRRLGIDTEANGSSSTLNRNGTAVSSYIWKNATGDGTVDLWVNQIGNILYFWRISGATTSSGASAKLQAATVTISGFGISGFNSYKTCQFADGNGYLFVFHPDCNPFYVTYTDTNTISGTAITLKIRDTEGIIESGVDDATRPLTLTDNHKYNLANQGWGKAWSTTSSTSLTVGTGSKTWTVASSTLPIVVGDRVKAINAGDAGGSSAISMTGIVTSYSGTSLTVSVATTSGAGTLNQWTITPQPPYTYDWFRAIGNYPSNSDQWWFFRNSSDAFAPGTEIDNVSANAGPAPKGYYILSLLDQQRDSVSGISGLTDVTSGNIGPSLGAWYAGRVWYAAVRARGFSESLYFSQIVESTRQFGFCYQLNDPTAEERSDLLPSDGGVIRIQGIGNIYKLFPTDNGLLVFSNRGIWFITGSQGIGFAANDYTVTKISNIRSISEWSFVNVRGYPMFWAEEGIYYVTPGQNGFEVKSLTDDTIASFYQDIPIFSKIYARGAFDPLNNVVRWIYKSSAPTSSTSENRFNFDRCLNYDAQINCFYPWTISAQSDVKVADVMYFQFGGNADSPSPSLKFYYTNSTGVNQTHSFADERDTTYKDWETPGTGVDYTSYFVTGYRLRGDAIRKWQSNWIRLYSDNADPSSFTVQPRWDYTITSTPVRWGTAQTVTMTNATDYGIRTKRLKLRGHGLAMQLKIASVTGEPFDIIGWSTWDSANEKL